MGTNSPGIGNKYGARIWVILAGTVDFDNE